MKMNRHFLALELHKILDMLADKTTLPDARAAALSLLPDTDVKTVELLLTQTDDASRVISAFGAPSFAGAHNTAPLLARAQAGAVLTMPELLDIGETLRTIRAVKEFYGNSPVQSGVLSRFFDRLFPNRYFEDKIFFAIKSEEELNDTASPELADIRRKIKAAGFNIKDRLDKLVRSQAGAKYLQDAIITQRDGRYVVPVKAEYRGEIKGLVHDTSASGATLFVEPMAVVEVNNELKILQAKEKEEIERILSALSAEAAGFADSILLSYESLVQLDLVFAKAQLGFSMRACKPKLNTDGLVVLKNARQPLLHPKTVVPISVTLGKDFHVLIITGSNTGGKTVALKTVGLLTGMAMCGLQIPADEGSNVCVFQKVLVDIGDEQSIEQSFSTFSAHMTNMISILSNADRQSLVLVDELGSGTDPVEGAALAGAMLQALMERQARVIATTHYAELKSFALDTPGVSNACVEFDTATLKPTYRLLVGMPGSSNAFAISQKLGLDAAIVADARARLDEKDQRFDVVLSRMQALERQAEQDRMAAARLREELEQQKQKAQQAEAVLKARQEKALADARERAQHIVDRVRGEANALLDVLEKTKKDAAKDAAAKLYAAKTAANQGLNRLYDLADPVQSTERQKYTLPRPLRPNDPVEIMDLGKAATVLAAADSSGQVQVLAGSMKMRVAQENLRLLEKAPPQPKKTRNVPVARTETVRTAASELDLRGMSSDEAILELDRFIDGAVLTGLTSIWIIHGKGTGVLRKAVQAHLKTHPSIKSYRLGVYGEGENGITVAELK